MVIAWIPLGNYEQIKDGKYWYFWRMFSPVPRQSTIIFFNGIMLTSCVYVYRVHAWCLLRFVEGYDSLKMQLQIVGNNHVNVDKWILVSCKRSKYSQSPSHLFNPHQSIFCHKELHCSFFPVTSLPPQLMAFYNC